MSTLITRSFGTKQQHLQSILMGENGMYTNRVQNTNKKFVQYVKKRRTNLQILEYKKYLCNPPPSHKYLYTTQTLLKLE